MERWLQVIVADSDEAAATASAHKLRMEGCRASAFRCDVTLKDEVGHIATFIIILIGMSYASLCPCCMTVCHT